MEALGKIYGVDVPKKIAFYKWAQLYKKEEKNYKMSLALEDPQQLIMKTFGLFKMYLSKIIKLLLLK